MLVQRISLTNLIPKLKQSKMKRDWDTLRWLLDEAESCEGGYPLVLTNGAASYGGQHDPLKHDSYSFAEIYEHILLLGDGESKLAHVRDFGHGNGAAIDRLTMQGHDFLEAARNDTVWNKAKHAATKVGGVSIDVFKDLLLVLLKAELAKHTGLNL